MTTLSDHYFGDLEAFDEAKANRDFFNNTFIAPSSMSATALKNNKKFIITGRKGVGKTAVQMKLAQELEARGYYTHHFRFMPDLRSDDYAEISRTQSDISYTEVSNDRRLFLHYDFRDVWERVMLRRIGEKLRDEKQISPFVEFVAPAGSRLKSIFEGIGKSLRVKINAPLGPIAASLDMTVDQLFGSSQDVALKTFNSISRQLFLKHCVQYQFYFFIDELVFSRLDAKPDEVTLRAAMVRDLLRSAWELNIFSAEKGLDFHFICSLRPEIRNLINDLDSESGKFLDGKDVDLTWFITTGDGEDLLVEAVLESKIRESHYTKPDPRIFITNHVSFGSRSLTLEEFLKTNTWGRPRDIVRLLNSIQKKSPNSTLMGQAEMKAALDDYSRSSVKEIIDELGVRFGQSIVNGLRQTIKKKYYASQEEFWRVISNNISGVDRNTLIHELFVAGVIGGYESGKGRHYWSYRGESYLKPQHEVRVHAGLWNEFSIRSS